MYRVINAASHEVLSLDEIETLDEAVAIADEIEQHDTRPEVAIQVLVDREWVQVRA